mmetsp:Transcript_11842/g.14511  ORF Transcript_11842/g.14511 Transcript_11842/m.14511 type:complete len:170 (-) Transcript_11842:45-554(-)
MAKRSASSSSFVCPIQPVNWSLSIMNGAYTCATPTTAVMPRNATVTTFFPSTLDIIGFDVWALCRFSFNFGRIPWSLLPLIKDVKTFIIKKRRKNSFRLALFSISSNLAFTAYQPTPSQDFGNVDVCKVNGILGGAFGITIHSLSQKPSFLPPFLENINTLKQTETKSR